MQQIQTMFKPLKMLSKLFASEELPEAKPYEFEYDRPIPNFNEFTENLFKQRYDTKRYTNPDELATPSAKRGRRVKSRN